MVYSPPILSEIQPNSGRAEPLATLSMMSATVMVVPPNRSTVFATLKSLAIARLLAGRIVSRRLDHLGWCRGSGKLVRVGAAQQPSQQENDRALADAEPEEGRLVARGLDHIADRNDAQGRPRPVARRGQAHGQPAPIRKPFHRMPDAGCVNRAAADAGENRAEIEDGAG